METPQKYEIGIVDTRKVVQTILNNYDFDLKDYALTSLKRRIEHAISFFGLSDADALIVFLQKDKDFFNAFMKELNVETTELFRDPSVWRMLRDTIIPELVRSSGSAKFLVPMITSGEELFSLCILLRESGLEEDCQIFATAFTGNIIDQIKKGEFNTKKIENSDSNYQKFSGKFEFQKYYSLSSNSAFWDKSLVENVQFSIQNTSFDNLPKGLRLVIFRNKLIYFNQVLGDKAVMALHQSLLPGGYLVTGTKESIGTGVVSSNFQLIDKNEKIYRRK
jgi:chemotaxis protein methyltransferase CheR